MCCGDTSAKTQKTSKNWTVENPDGSTKKVKGEADARLAAAKSGGKVVPPSR